MSRQQQIERLKNTLKLVRHIKFGAIQSRLHMSIHTAYNIALDALLSSADPDTHIETFDYPRSYGNVDAPHYKTTVTDDTLRVEAQTIFDRVTYDVDITPYVDTSFTGSVVFAEDTIVASGVNCVFNLEPFEDYIYVFDTINSGRQLATYRGRRHDGVHLYTSLYNPVRCIELSEELQTVAVNIRPELISLNDFF